MCARPTVVFGLLGSTLDRAGGPDRWERWRPTVALGQFEDLRVARLELIVDPRFGRIADTVVADLARVSPETTVLVHPRPQRDPWDFAEVYEDLYTFAREYAFDEGEDYLVHMTTGTHVAQICLFLLTEARHIPGRLLQTSPPHKDAPEGTYRVIDLDLGRYDALAARFEAEQAERKSFLKAGIETRNTAFNELIDEIEHVVLHSSAPMLVTGETGVGKTQLARRVYELARRERRVEGAFVEVNCATLRGDQASAALFGHTRGAFTGAERERAGLLAAADGGLLFLDEIGELGLDEQAMVLRAIEEGTYLRLGSDEPASSRFQLVAGTNRDLAARVAEGAFREDLLARIDLWTFRLPSLRERPEDIEPNLDFELERYARETDRRATLTLEARSEFLRFATSAAASWPGNFRDFAGAVTRLATLSKAGRIGRDAVRAEIARLERRWARHARGASGEDLVGELLGARASDVDLFDRVQLEEVLRVCRASPSLAAAGRVLFAVSRERRTSRNDSDRVRKYLARYELEWEDVQGARA